MFGDRISKQVVWPIEIHPLDMKVYLKINFVYMKNEIVGLRELRENIDTYISQVKRGKSFIVVRRSKPVFKIVSPDEEELWETVADFTKIRKEGIPAKQLLTRLRAYGKKD